MGAMENIKGHTIIELTDVNTGEVTRTESDNMVTDALQKIFTPIGVLHNSQYTLDKSLSRLYQTLTGGIFLFDGKIEESKQTIYAPASVSMTGCGVYGQKNLNENIARGDFNQGESEARLEDGYVKYVYDFPTNISNGTIASVCLTHKYGGYCGYGSESAKEVHSGPLLSHDLTPETWQYYYLGEQPFPKGVLLDLDSNALYAAKYDKAANAITISKWHGYLQSISIFDDPANSARLLSEQTIALDANVSKYSPINFNIDNESWLLYAVFFNGNPPYDIVVAEINLFDNQKSEYQISTNLEKKMSRSYVYQKHLFCSSGEREGGNIPDMYMMWYVYDVATGEKIQEVKGTDAFPAYGNNGRLYFDGGDSSDYHLQYACIIDSDYNVKFLETENIFLTMKNTPPIPVKGMPWAFFVAPHRSFCMPANYLATINNLENPITKTNQQTMKVTYTLERA